MQHSFAYEEIRLKKYLTKQDITDIKALQDICYSYDKVNLKLELDYRRDMERTMSGLGQLDEFLYYIDGKLVSYLSISCFSSRIAEITGMTHPEFRRKGIFSRLFNLATAEVHKRDFRKVLLLADRKSEAGAAFIASTGAKYDLSEYYMQLPKLTESAETGPVGLRNAEQKDLAEIRRQDCIYFDEEMNEDEIEISGHDFAATYMAELDGKVIGKIRIDISGDSAYLLGFGILPEYRGRGLGKATLKEALRLLAEKGLKSAALDVVATNANALNLYKSSGFTEASTMDYYCYASSDQ